MSGYSIRHKLGGVYHITSTVLNQCPAITRSGHLGNWSVDDADTPQAALDMIAKWGGRVCKNCRKNVDAATNGAPAYNFAPLGAGREMPSLEEIATETPLPLPLPVIPSAETISGKLTHVVTWTYEGNTFDSFHRSEEFANNKADHVRAEGGQDVKVEECAVIANRVAQYRMVEAALEKAKTTTTRNREAWLTDAVEAVTALFTEQGHKVPAVRISVGWPGGKGRKGMLQTIGQCWHSANATDGTPQIFISPYLIDPVKILDVVIHELVHAVDDCKSGHRGAFKKIAVSVGLEGKMTATVAGEKLRGRLVEIAAGLGDYPHAKLTPNAPRTTAAGRNRQLKVMCDCGNIARQSRQAIDTYGTPVCGPCGTHMYEA